MAESLSYALLTILERLSPTERAVFLLHETFRYPYDEIARIIGETEANCRQVATRARQHLGAEPRFDVTPNRHEELIDKLINASRVGFCSIDVEIRSASCLLTLWPTVCRRSA